eukprot:7970553-Pyramimonas_sp.AAC.1
MLVVTSYTRANIGLNLFSHMLFIVPYFCGVASFPDSFIKQPTPRRPDILALAPPPHQDGEPDSKTIDDDDEDICENQKAEIYKAMLEDDSDLEEGRGRGVAGRG